MIVLSSSVRSDLIESIAARIGPDTEILSTISEARYRRWSAGGSAARTALRFLGWVVHPVRLLARLLTSPRGTIFVVTTNPFFAPALAVGVGSWREHRVVHHVFDLYPDALEAAGAIPENGWQSRFIAGLTRSAQQGCAGAVYLGRELQRHTERRHGAARRSAVIDVAADESLFNAADRDFSGPLTLHYGGQLGRMHDAAALVEAVRRLRSERETGSVGFDFRVGGAWSGQLLALSGEPGVVVGPVLPAEEWRRHVSGMQVGLVSLTAAGANVCLPSKTYALLAAGLAVIAVAPASGDLAGIIEETGAGWVVDNSARRDGATESEVARSSGDMIAEIVRRLLRNPDEIRVRRDAARAAATGRFGRDEISGRWRNFLAELR
jgi:glycosyltransferase involved in cell wall biosynthesis